MSMVKALRILCHPQIPFRSFKLNGHIENRPHAVKHPYRKLFQSKLPFPVQAQSNQDMFEQRKNENHTTKRLQSRARAKPPVVTDVNKTIERLKGATKTRTYQNRSGRIP